MAEMNEEALEAVARSICCPDDDCPKWQSCTWKDWIPEASAAITAYTEALQATKPDAVAVERAVEAERVRLLAIMYRKVPVDTAKLCDETLDRSGRLLGLVRDAARSQP